MNTDPISDFLTRIRNANLVGKTQVEVPYSKIKSNISEILIMPTLAPGIPGISN